jgi:hypothetical protein
MEHPQLLDRKNFKHGEDLLERGKALFQSEKYNAKVRAVLEEMKNLVHRISEDTITKQLGDDMKQLVQDIMFDSEGKFSASQLRESMSQLRSMIVPILLSNLEKLPIPKISGTSPKYDYSVENLNFNVKEILPENFYYDLKSEATVKLKELNTTKGRTFFRVKLSDMNVMMKDVKFYFKRKVSPAYEDWGVVDIDLRGSEIYIEFVLETSEKLPWHFAAVRTECDLGNLYTSIKQARHNVIDNVITTLFHKRVKHTLERQIDDTVIKYLTEFCTQANKFIFNYLQPAAAKAQGHQPAALKQTPKRRAAPQA